MQFGDAAVDDERALELVARLGEGPNSTKPITGTSVPRYQIQPTARYGRVRAQRSASAERRASSTAEPATCQTGSPSPGWG